MFLLSALAEKYRRLRHTYGYGVHSPYAYLLLEQTRRIPRYAYYADDEIIKSAEGLGCRVKRRALMLHRLAARYHFDRVFLTADVPEPFILAIKKGDPNIEICRDFTEKAHLAISCGELQNIAIIETLLNDGAIVIIFSKKAVETLKTGLKEYRGLMLHGDDFILIQKREDMAFTKYSVAL